MSEKVRAFLCSLHGGRRGRLPLTAVLERTWSSDGLYGQGTRVDRVSQAAMRIGQQPVQIGVRMPAET